MGMPPEAVTAVEQSIKGSRVGSRTPAHRFSPFLAPSRERAGFHSRNRRAIMENADFFMAAGIQCICKLYEEAAGL